MNPCERYQQLIPAYVDGEATAEEKAILEAHLKQCAECRAVESRVRRLRRLLQSLPAVSTSPEFGAILRARIRLEKRKAGQTFIPSFPTWRVPAFGLAAVAAALLFVAVLWNSGRIPHRGSVAVTSVYQTAEMATRLKAPVDTVMRRVHYVLDRVPAQTLGTAPAVIASRSLGTRALTDSSARQETYRLVAERIRRASF